MMDKLISQKAAIDAIKKRLFETAFNNVGIKQNIDETLVDVAENRLEIWFNELPPVQPERKDAIEKAVAVEAISDELLSRFDISATYAYDVAENAMNRIEAMAKEMGKGEQE